MKILIVLVQTCHGNRPDKVSVPHRGAAIMNYGGNQEVQKEETEKPLL